jgi:hypothetical protein
MAHLVAPAPVVPDSRTIADRIRHLDENRKIWLKDAVYLRPTAGAFIQQRFEYFRQRAKLVEQLGREQPNGKPPEKLDVSREIYKDVCALDHLRPPLSPAMARWRAAIVNNLRADVATFKGQLERLVAEQPKTVYAVPVYDQAAHHAKRHHELSSVIAAVQARLERLDDPQADQKRAAAVAAVLVDPGRVVELITPGMEVPGAQKVREAREHPGLKSPKGSYHFSVADKALKAAEAKYRAAQEQEAARLVDLGLTGAAAAVLELAEVIARGGQVDLAVELHTLCGDDAAFIALINDQFQNGSVKRD